MAAIILARHGEPALSRKVRLSSAQYREWWARYEVGGIFPGQAPPPELAEIAAGAQVLLCSTRRRSIETARALAGERGFVEDAALIEAPLPPPAAPAWLKLSPRWWGFIARVWWWFFNHHRGEECRAAAQARADDVADRLIGRAEKEGDTLVVAHGFFNTMVGRALKQRGWRCTRDGGYAYWAARRFEPVAPERRR